MGGIYQGLRRQKPHGKVTVEFLVNNNTKFEQTKKILFLLYFITLKMVLPRDCNG